jgi:hypothetical protein
MIITTHFSAILFIQTKATLSLPLAYILQTLALLCFVTDTKYFPFHTLHFLLVIDVHFYQLQSICSYKIWSDFLLVGGGSSASRTMI